MKKENKMTEGIIWKQLLSFFFPILLGTFFQQIYNTADAIIVGNFVGKEALAAVGGNTATLINLVLGFFVGLASGGEVMVSQYYGAENKEGVSKGIHTAVALGIVGGAVLGILGIVMSAPVLTAMHVPDDILGHALIYLRIYYGGLVFMAVYNIAAGILRASGDSKRPLYFLIFACFLNIVLDILFVAVCKMGVAGAALATVIAQGATALLLCRVLWKRNDAFRLILHKIGFDKSVLIKIIKIGIPAGLQSAMYAFSNIIVQAGINRFGTDTIAAVAAFDKMDAITWAILGTLGVTVSVFAGQNYGAQKYARIHRCIRVAIGMGMAMMAVLSTVMILSGRFLFRIFIDDPAVLEIGMEIMCFIVPFYVIFACVDVLAGAMRGVGDAWIPALLTCLGACVLRIIWVFATQNSLGDIRVIMACYPVSWVAMAGMFLIYYKSYSVLHKKIEPEDRTGQSPYT